MKKIWLPLLAVLLLCACGGENDRAEELQERYQQVSSYETDVRVCVPRKDETIAYCLHLSAQGDTVRAEVKEPQELAGVGAVLEGERLSLTFDGLVLDVGTLSPRVSALNCAPMLLRTFPKAYLDSFGTETLGGEIVLHVAKMSSGLVLFNQVEKKVEEFLRRYQSRIINDFEPFTTINPTLENLTEFLLDSLQKELNPLGWMIFMIEVSETPARTYVMSLLD